MTVNLPIFIYAHAVGLVIVGARLLFFDHSSRAPLGIATIALGACYLVISYMPYDDNAFLHASGPTRIALAGLAGLKLLQTQYSRDKTASADRSALLAIMLYDGLGGLHLCWWLGNFSGRAPGIQPT